VSDWGDMLVAGVLGKPQEEVVQTKLFIPKNVATRDVLDFVVVMGRPIQQVLAYPDGFEITFNLAPTQQGRVLTKATMYGMVIGGRQHYAAQDTVGITEPVTIDELLNLPVAEISAWLADHEEELGIKDYEVILAKEVAGKKRSTVVKGLKALIGEE